MKSRRVLQIFVAVLSIILLVCLAAVAAVLYLGNLLSFLPQQLVEFGDTFKAGLKTVSDVWKWLDWSTPALFFGVPGGALLLAVILILTKNKGKDAKNVAGCIFALIGVVALAAFSFIYAKTLYAESALLIAYCVNGGVLALFVIFVGCALGVKAKSKDFEEIEIADDGEPQSEETVATQEEAVATEEREELAESEVEAAETPEQDTEQEANETVEETEAEQEGNGQVQQEDEEDVFEDTPATQYVPNLGVTIHDIVAKTYGKENSELTSTTLAKIKKVRALYEAKAISEQEYIKLINKYLGF